MERNKVTRYPVTNIEAGNGDDPWDRLVRNYQQRTAVARRLNARRTNFWTLLPMDRPKALREEKRDREEAARLEAERVELEAAMGRGE